MEEEKKVSKFSSGLNIITRLDSLWRKCQELKRNGRYSDWNDELDTIWLELARDFVVEDYNDKVDEKGKTIRGYKSQFDEFEGQLKLWLPFHDSSMGFKAPDKEVIKRRNAQYKILMEKQLFLARLENELDKGTTYEEGDEDF